MNPEITLKQYENIYRIVSSIGNHFAHGAGRSCQFYNVNGALILQQLLKIKARPVMGAAFIRLNASGDTVSFAGEEDGNFYSSPDAFHCWVETPNFIIDFTAPEYREAASQLRTPSIIPRQMFQKEKKLMSTGPYSMANAGDFYFCQNKELTIHLLEKMSSRIDAQDFANICCDWYTKLSKSGVEETIIMNDLGEATPIKLIGSNLTAKW